ncbi:MAG TPA: serpin family protein [Streptosporangiaceae bacterium]|nr:serpin family protein [Streptosporangiaceae bacterium]
MRDEPAAPTATAERAAVAADAAFGADLYRTLAEDAPSMVFSPASVASALRMALCGARGQTAAELARALHLAPSSRPEAAAVSGLSLVRPGRDGGSATFRAPNTVWVQSGLPLRAEFTGRLDQAAAALAGADFAAAPDAARTEINRVIATQTAGKITGLLPPGTITALTRLVLASAVYLKAAWAEPFPERATADAPFHPDGPALAVPMMRGTAARSYLRGDGYQAVLLPYRDIGLAMAVLLPDGPLAALRPKVAAAGLGGLLAGTATYQVTLSLPRFRLEAAFDLIPALQRLGVTEAFSGDADFGGITGAEPLQIGAVAHKAYIDVDERGTEAAAATAVVFRTRAAMRPPPPVTMVVDRPFLFAIIDTTTSLPVFLGQVTRPGPG